MAKDKWVQKFIIPGSNGAEWTVGIDAEGGFGCSCPVWKFKRQECKHIREVKDNIDILVSNLPGEANKPNVVLAKVYKPELRNGELYIPLVPFGDVDMSATIVYHMMKCGYTMREIRKIRGCCCPESWTAKAVLEHIKVHGEAQYPLDYYKTYRNEGAEL